MQIREHTYDYLLHGQDNQTLEIELQEHQSIHAENGAMSFMEQGITMTTGTGRQRGPLDLLKRKVSGESILLSIFTNEDIIPQRMGLSPQHPAHILPITLNPQGPDIICQKDSFLAGHPEVRVSAALASIKNTIFGSSNLIMQRLHGAGQVFLTGNGTVIERELETGETYLSEPAAIVAFQDTVEYNTRIPRGVSNVLWSREKLFLLSLTGPGRVWFQSTARFQGHNTRAQRKPHS